MRFRLIPITMALCTLLLGVKILDIVDGSQRLSNALLVAQVSAEEEKEQLPEVKTPEVAKPAEEKKESASAEKPAEVGPEEPKKETATETAKSEGEAKPAEKEKPENKKEFSQSEIYLLQSLAKRREELDQWAKQVEVKEQVLKATEMRIDQKLEEMKKLKEEVAVALAEYNKQEDSKIRSLVKIYENMKAKDAARIFEQMEMPILLLVVDRMSERKVAPILAAMNPQKAQAVTAELAEQRRLQKVPSLPAEPAAGGATN